MPEPLPVPGSQDVPVHVGVLRAVNVAVHRPRLRGTFHVGAFPLSLLTTALLVLVAEGDRGKLAALLFGGTISLVLGTSGAYHSIRWPPGLARWARRIDHSVIYLSIPAGYTAAWLSALQGRPLADALLVVSWSGALVGVAFKLLWIDAPKWIGAASYCVLGLSLVAAVPQLAAAVGSTAITVLLLAGVLQVVGAAVYVLERPDPLPHLFGYHEIFHMLVTVGIGLQFAAFAVWIIPR